MDEAANISALDRAEEFSRLAEYAPARFAYLDPDLRCLFVSNLYEELVGVPRDQLVGRLVEEIVSEKSFAVLKPQFETALSGNAASFEATLPDFSGRRRRFKCHVWPDVGSDGTVHGLYVIDHELTETERINDALLARERRLLHVLEAASVIPWEADPQTWRFTYVGAQAERILGYPLDQWFDDDFWTSKIFPEDREFAINYCETCSKTLTDFEFEYRMVKADGDVIWLRDIVNVDLVNGVPQILRGFMIDITAAKQLEKTLRNDHDLVIETVPHGIEEIDTSGIITLANSALHKMYEYEAGELIGMSIFDIVAESSEREELRSYLRYLLEAQPAPTLYYGKRRTRSGRALDVEIAWNYRRDSQGRLIGFTSVITDITEHKRAQEALRESHNLLERRVKDRTQKLRATNEALKATEMQLRRNAASLRQLSGRLIAAQEEERRRIGRDLHDDLTQCLAALAIDAGRLEQRDDVIEGSDNDGLHKIKERLMELSEYVHSLSRQLHPAIVEDLGIVVALRSLCEEIQQHEGVLIDFKADGVSDDVPSDHALCIYRVAQEALRNVVKHSHATQADVHLHSTNGALQFQVRDNGVGFKMNDARNQIGLGLQSMEERVRYVGGAVQVKTGPGDGTEISVRIPLT